MEILKNPLGPTNVVGISMQPLHVHRVVRFIPRGSKRWRGWHGRLGTVGTKLASNYKLVDIAL